MVTEIQKTPPNQTEAITAKSFFVRAQAFMAAMKADVKNNFQTIAVDTPSFDLWREYFERHLGFTPWFITALLTKQIERATVPMEFPQWFDSSFMPDPTWRPMHRPGSTPPPKDMRDSYEEMQKRYGANWGIQNMRDQRTRPRYQRLTDQELRDVYNPPMPEGDLP